VRELQNVIERAVILAQDGTLTFDLPQLDRAPAKAEVSVIDIISDVEWRRRERATFSPRSKRRAIEYPVKAAPPSYLGSIRPR